MGAAHWASVTQDTFVSRLHLKHRKMPQFTALCPQRSAHSWKDTELVHTGPWLPGPRPAFFRAPSSWVGKGGRGFLGQLLQNHSCSPSRSRALGPEAPPSLIFQEDSTGHGGKLRERNPGYCAGSPYGSHARVPRACWEGAHTRCVFS